MRIASSGGMDRDNKILELSLINDSLQKDVLAKDREIRNLNKALQQYEQTITRMRDHMNPDVFKKDAEVMAGMCCTGTECGDLVPVKDFGELLREETSKDRERLQNMEVSLKSSSVKLRTVHKVNLGLIEELNSLRRVCIAVEMERRDLRLKYDLEGQIVKQMVRQLRQAKAKNHACVATSTPDGTQVLPDDAEISIIPSQQSIITISEEDLDEGSILFKLCTCDDNDVYDQTTLKLDTPDVTQNLNHSQNLKSESSLKNQSGNLPNNTSHSSMNPNRNIQIESSSITSQSARNQSISLVSQRSPRNTSKNQEPASSQSLLRLRRCATPAARTRKPSELQSDSSKSTRNQSTNPVYNDQSQSKNNILPKRRRENLRSESSCNMIYEHSSRENIDNLQSTASNQSQSTYYIAEGVESTPNVYPDSSQSARSESKNIITESSLPELGENMRLDSEQRPRYPSRYGIDPGIKLEHSTSQSSRNKKIPTVPPRNQNENPPEYSPCTINPNLEQDESHSRSKDQLKNEEHLTEEASSKSESDKENNTEECQCQCTCEQIKACQNLTVSDKRWLITPEGIMKGLEALKQSFLGKIEDYTSNTNETAQAGASSSKNQSSETTRKKSVTIQEPVRSNKCDYCNLPESCEEEADGSASPNRDREVQESERCVGSQGSESMFFVENVDVKSRSVNREPTENEEGCSEPSVGARRLLGAKLVKKESALDSGGSSCAGACEQYYRDKLLATLQILENKEETIRVQGSSLAVAGDRIAELTKRASELRRELENKARELNHIREFASSRVDKIDVSASAEMEEAEAQKHLIETLEDNLSTVLELYRECFYETAKQEDLIEMLRKSCLDVRLMDKDKSEKITRLQNVINTQKRSIEQCQDVVLEVESLKSEISSFLNSSNNDSGMWERGSETPDVGEELADILEQLRLLQQMLTSDCTCGLKEENSSLKERNRALEVELEKQRQRNNELNGAMKQILDQQYEKLIKEKEQELQEVVKKLADVEDNRRKRDETCETLTRQLQQAKVMLDDKTAELMEAHKSREAQESTIRRLKQDLAKSEQLVQEGLKKLSEVAHSRSELLLESQATISELEQRIRHAARRCRELEAGCREREACLEEAHARGALLCEESRRVTAGVKQWMREKKQLTREQQEKIKMQNLKIRELERRLGVGPNLSELTSQSETDPCSNSTHEYNTCGTGYRCSRLNPACRSETAPYPRAPVASRVDHESEESASCSKCASHRRDTNEDASCSRAPAPVPPRRKRQSCEGFNFRHSSQPSRDRYDSPGPDIRWSRLYSRVRHSSPTDEMLERVEHLHAALSAGQRRWGRPRR